MPQLTASDRRGILLVNLGSPDSTSVKDVRRYLRQFLMDGRVIDAPYPLRKMIVELFILPFRPASSAHAYQQIWWDEGSPLIVLSRRLESYLKKHLSAPVALGMRYGNPSIESAIRQLLQTGRGIEEVHLLPLYPHYAMATVETVVVEVQRVLKKLAAPLRLTVRPPFYADPGYINALVESARPYLEAPYDHLLFSYHGIPERHCRKADPTGRHCLTEPDCCQVPSPAHATCYRHQVYRTTGEFVRKAGVASDKYSLSFQSRLGVDSWLKPFTAEELKRLGEKGIKKLIVMCPAFVSDCLETLEEIGLRGKETFLAAGGEEFRLIPCLNDHPLWMELLASWCASSESAAAPAAGRAGSQLK